MALTGVYLTLTSNDTSEITPKVIDWDAAAEHGATFWSAGSPSRITIPSGVSMMTFYCGGYIGVTNSSLVNQCLVRKDGTTNLLANLTSDADYCGVGYTTGLRNVSTGEYYENRLSNLSGTLAWDASHAYFAAFTPESTLGVVSAKPTAPVTITGTAAAVSWDAPDVDTHSTHDGTTGFVAPNGAQYVMANMSLRFDSLTGTNRTAYHMKVNGVIRRVCDTKMSQWGGQTMLGPTPVAADDVVTFEAYSATSKTIDESISHLSLEWIG